MNVAQLSRYKDQETRCMADHFGLNDDKSRLCRGPGSPMSYSSFVVINLTSLGCPLMNSSPSKH